jgi:hypothetical protein
MDNTTSNKINEDRERCWFFFGVCVGSLIIMAVSTAFFLYWGESHPPNKPIKTIECQ